MIKQYLFEYNEKLKNSSKHDREILWSEVVSNLQLMFPVALLVNQASSIGDETTWFDWSTKTIPSYEELRSFAFSLERVELSTTRTEFLEIIAKMRILSNRLNIKNIDSPLFEIESAVHDVLSTSYPKLDQ